MNRSPDWLHQAQADFDQALLSARGGITSGPASVCTQLANAVNDLDLLLIDAATTGPQHERLLSCSSPNRAFPASSSGMPCGCGVGG